MLEFIARRKMNTYFYAPKDDPYHRRKWAKPYDPESLGKLKEVIEHARRLGLDFYYCLAPGLSMKYSDSEHLRLLKEKAKQIFDLGVRRFGLFFDDIPGKLQHADDRVRFSSLAEAHVHVCNAF